MAPAADLAHLTPSSFSAVLRKYCVESPRDMTRALMMSPGRRDFTTSTLSTSVARMSCWFFHMLFRRHQNRAHEQVARMSMPGSCPNQQQEPGLVLTVRARKPSYNAQTTNEKGRAVVI